MASNVPASETNAQEAARGKAHAPSGGETQEDQRGLESLLGDLATGLGNAAVQTMKGDWENVAKTLANVTMKVGKDTVQTIKTKDWENVGKKLANVTIKVGKAIKTTDWENIGKTLANVTMKVGKGTFDGIKASLKENEKTDDGDNTEARNRVGTTAEATPLAPAETTPAATVNDINVFNNAPNHVTAEATPLAPAETTLAETVNDMNLFNNAPNHVKEGNNPCQCKMGYSCRIHTKRNGRKLSWCVVEQTAQCNKKHQAKEKMKRRESLGSGTVWWSRQPCIDHQTTPDRTPTFNMPVSGPYEAKMDVCEKMRMSSTLKRFLECDNHGKYNPDSCKAYIRTRRRQFVNCDGFCASLGPEYRCYEAYKEETESSECKMRFRNKISCSGPNNDDFVCGCERVTNGRETADAEENVQANESKEHIQQEMETLHELM